MGRATVGHQYGAIGRQGLAVAQGHAVGCDLGNLGDFGLDEFVVDVVGVVAVGGDFK